MVGEPSLEKAINQLQELFQKGYIYEPIYYEEEVYIDNNYKWKIECHVDGYKYYYHAIENTKKSAKKQAAFSMLLYIFEVGIL